MLVNNPAEVEISYKLSSHLLSLPYDTAYAGEQLVYNKMRNHDMVFANQLHEGGIGEKRPMKPIIQGGFYAKNAERGILRDALVVEDGRVSQLVRALDENYLEVLLQGLVKDPVFSFRSSIGDISLKAVEVYRIKTPEFRQEAEYSLLTPCVVSKPDGKYGKYLMPDHEEFNEYLVRNIRRKVKLFTGLGVEEGDINFKLINGFKERLNVIKPLSEHPVKVKGSKFDFMLTAPPLVHTILYHTGLGEKNMAGFGLFK